MDNTDRHIVLKHLDKFVSNHRIAISDRERESANYLAYGFIDAMTLDIDERRDFKEIYRNKIGVRELESVSA